MWKAHVFACARECMCRLQDNLRCPQEQPTLFFDWDFPWVLETADSTSCPMSFEAFLPPHPRGWACHHTQLFTQALGIKLSCSYLYRKHFANQVKPPLQPTYQDWKPLHPQLPRSSEAIFWSTLHNLQPVCILLFQIHKLRSHKFVSDHVPCSTWTCLTWFKIWSRYKALPPVHAFPLTSCLPIWLTFTALVPDAHPHS